MGTWLVDLYDNKDDAQPSRRGLVEAETEDEATQVIGNNMGDSQRAVVQRVILKNVEPLKAGVVNWI